MLKFRGFLLKMWRLEIIKENIKFEFYENYCSCYAESRYKWKETVVINKLKDYAHRQEKPGIKNKLKRIVTVDLENSEGT